MPIVAVVMMKVTGIVMVVLLTMTMSMTITTMLDIVAMILTVAVNICHAKYRQGKGSVGI